MNEKTINLRGIDELGRNKRGGGGMKRKNSEEGRDRKKLGTR
jgi:hypothetical protein